AVREGVDPARRARRHAQPPGHSRDPARRGARRHAGRSGVVPRGRAQHRRDRQSVVGERSGLHRGLAPDRRARPPRRDVPREGVLMPDIAIVGYAQSPSWREAELTEPQFLFPVIADAISMANIDRRDIGFTCAGSCDYLSGQTFAFVMNLEAVGAWPPISESHVEMDGAWAMYEAWVRLQHGD